MPLHSARFESVVVEKQDDDNYIIEMVPINCAHNIPILQVAYADTVQGRVYNDSRWGDSKVLTLSLVRI